MKALNLRLLILVVIFYSSSCKETKITHGITGSVKLENLSTVIIYPMAKGKNIHNVGVVGIGSFKVMGFTDFSLDDDVQVQWIEKHIDNPEKIVHFDMSLLRDLVGKTKALEFSYQGDDIWILRVYSKDPSTEDSFLKKIQCKPYTGEIGKPRDWTR
jgi:hypothetical protein